MRFILAATLALLAACASTEPTEVVLVIDGEFVTPTEVDTLEVTIVSPLGDTRMATIPLDASSGFPRTLGLLRGDGGGGIYSVTVTAKLGATTVVSRKASFEFVSNRIRMLRVDLLRACKNVLCTGMDRTCGEGGLCQRTYTDTDPWAGEPASRFEDAGMSIGPIVAP